MEYLLAILLLTPLIFAVLAAWLPDGAGGRAMGLAGAILTSVVAAFVAVNYDWSAGGTQLALTGWQLHTLGFGIKLGIDSIGVWLMLLTCLLHVVTALVNFRGIEKQAEAHSSWTLVMLFALLGVWMARDLLLFYFFYELTLVPLFFLVGIWGQDERRAAAAKLFLYAFAGSVFTLAAFVYIGMSAGTFDIAGAIHHARQGFTENQRFWVLLGLLAGFLIKTPLFPLHTWLPQAHDQSNIAGGTDIGSMQLKIGAFGLLTIALPIGMTDAAGNIVVFATDKLPFVETINIPLVLAVLALSAIIYGALVAWVQKDAKRVIAYSTVSHLGFIVLGIVAATDLGLQSAVLYMLNTALATAAMFAMIGMVQLRLGTRTLESLSGLARLMPTLAFFFVYFVMAGIGLPGFGPFISEFLTLMAAAQATHLGIGVAIVAGSGILLSAIYMLNLTARMMFGPVKLPAGVSRNQATDLNTREVTLLTLLAVPILLLGVLPSPVLKSVLPDVKALRSIQASSPASGLPGPTLSASNNSEISAEAR